MSKSVQHWSILTDVNADKKQFMYSLEKEDFPRELQFLTNLKGVLFSKKNIDYFIKKEEIHGIEILQKEHNQALKNLSSGEQKITFLKHIIKQEFDYLIIDNLFDSLDAHHFSAFKKTLTEIAKTTSIIQITSRKSDILPFISNFLKLKGSTITRYDSYKINSVYTDSIFKGKIPKPIRSRNHQFNTLVKFSNVSVSYWDRKILNAITWEIKQGEFWQLKGENGSGKSTLISLITGDNHKAYGQNLILFDRLRGTGETIWDIKNNIGYFTPSMVYNFKGHHTVLHMIISGIQDSIGLYTKPSEMEINKALEWLQLLEMEHLKNTYFKNLSKGNQRLIMLVRAFIKWPSLLILDEPTVDLDDESVHKFANLLNKFHQESIVSIVYVSHRNEKGITPQKTINLIKTKNGSTHSFE